ncbi:hypothetical protein T265_07097 [Opisthorchis viverrini]|uniref:Uncharacterized protein n=1 Tax=Opisthorchis viverrini TaxID=6198 RepID=A0A074ZQ06_OPIVI|nr:hypothetical protein T265_07097 [Opisthorchis viverrini]KER25415.1 hypothetical protein T265_07097 [Opisthorchis viverrini]
MSHKKGETGHGLSTNFQQTYEQCITNILARLFPLAKAFSISRAFDVHQSSRSFLRLFTIWRLGDSRAPSNPLPAGMGVLAPIMDNDLDDIQWSCGRIGEVGQAALNAARIAPFTFCHASSTCSLPPQYCFTVEKEMKLVTRHVSKAGIRFRIDLSRRTSVGRNSTRIILYHSQSGAATVGSPS